MSTPNNAVPAAEGDEPAYLAQADMKSAAYPAGLVRSWTEHNRERYTVKLYTRSADPQPKGMPQAIQATIGKLLAEAMNAAASNGANSVSMPDEYVQLAVWLASANGQCCERAAGPGQVCDECASVNAAYSADMAPVREAQAPAPGADHVADASKLVPASVPHPLQGACRYISDVLASDAPAGEKHIARTIMHLLPLVPAPAPSPAEAHGLPADAFAVNLMRLAGLDKHKARECEEIVRQVLAANVQPKGSDKANEWRKLAQQFDGQRMAAMAHLRTLLMFPDTHAEAVRAFLAATPAEQIASVQAPAPTQAWNHTTAELSAIYGEMAAINETPAKHQTEAQRERLNALRAEAVAIGVRRYALAAQANVRPKKAGG